MTSNAYVAVDPAAGRLCRGGYDLLRFPDHCRRIRHGLHRSGGELRHEAEPGRNGNSSTRRSSRATSTASKSTRQAAPTLGGDRDHSVPGDGWRTGQTAVGNEAFTAKLNIGGTALEYATYIGGRGADDASRNRPRRRRATRTSSGTPRPSRNSRSPLARTTRITRARTCSSRRSTRPGHRSGTRPCSGPAASSNPAIAVDGAGIRLRNRVRPRADHPGCI